MCIISLKHNMFIHDFFNENHVKNDDYLLRNENLI